MIGRRFGHYVVLEKIGAGGMGEVYRAHDQRLERDVALKILPPGFLADEPARKSFRREAPALSKLNHPNIATVFDFDTQEGVDFLAMELIHGAEARAAGSISDYRRQQTVAQKAAASGSAQGARLLVATAQLLEGNALLGLRQLDEARQVCENANKTFAAAGDRGNAANALNSIGNIFFRRGEFSKAEEILKQALSIHREIGNKRGVAASLNNLAGIRYRQDDLPTAKRFYEDSLQIRREIDDQLNAAAALNNQAALAETLAQEAAAEFQTEKRGMDEASARGVVAQSQLAQGKLADARKAIDLATKLSAESAEREERLSIFTTAARVRAVMAECMCIQPFSIHFATFWPL